MVGEFSLRPLWLLVILLLYVSMSLHIATSSDADALLKFKDTMSGDSNVLADWVKGSSPCLGDRASWTGLICDNGSVLGLQLENMSLSGTLNLDALMELPGLRTLSFMNNGFEGPMPNVGKMGALRSIYLSMNRFSGEIPDDAFARMGSLKKLHLSQNELSGPIPTSLAGVSRLLELRLDDNNFDGSIPDLRQPELKLLNLSHNDLEGKIPDSLSKMDASLFSGNKNLCGAPIGVSCKSRKKFSTPLLVGIIVIALGVVLAIAGVIFVKLRRRGRVEEMQLGRHPSSNKTKKVAAVEVDQMEHGTAGYAGSRKTVANDLDQGRLVFVREDRVRFELQDLLRASAEVLGSGSVGYSYKAVLLNGPSMVVKRIKEMNGVGKQDFHEHMRRLGSLSHPNLLPLVAYHYRTEEKLLLTDYISNGSLAHLLHGNHVPNQPTLDWLARLKIIKGVARGLAYLYNELPMLSLPHGHLKSSNVLLDNSFEALLADYALAPVMNQAHASQVMEAYKSPEYMQYGRTSKKSEAWCLGILILEILTGKHPANYPQPGKGGKDLASWVKSVVREEWTGEVFDSGMRGTVHGEREMLKLLQIGMGCCEANIEKRWELKEALKMIEEMNQRERDIDEDYSSFISEGEMYSRTMTEDDFSFSRNY